MKYIQIFIIVITFYMCFWNLGEQPLERWDEQTNAAVIKEFITHPSPVLTYHGKPFFEKPPLWYFMTGLMVNFLGESNFTYRLVSAISGFLLILFTLFLTSKIFSPVAGVFSVLVLLTTGQLFYTGAGGFFATHNFRSADPDSLHILLIFLSFLYLYKYLQGNKFSIYVSGIFAALSFLTKGPMGFLPLVTYGAFRLISHFGNHNPVKNIRYQKIIKILLFILLIILPWYLYVYALYGNTFTEEHFVYHQFLRFTQSLEGQGRNWYYYLQILNSKKLFAFSELLIISLLWFIYKLRQKLTWEYFSPVFIVITVFLIATLSQTKLSWYILTVYPFTGMLIGEFVEKLFRVGMPHIKQ